MKRREEEESPRQRGVCGCCSEPCEATFAVPCRYTSVQRVIQGATHPWEVPCCPECIGHIEKRLHALEANEAARGMRTTADAPILFAAISVAVIISVVLLFIEGSRRDIQSLGIILIAGTLWAGLCVVVSVLIYRKIVAELREKRQQALVYAEKLGRAVDWSMKLTCARAGLAVVYPGCRQGQAEMIEFTRKDQNLCINLPGRGR